ncbi:unnamed protein product [Rotaria socialis]
MSQDFILANPHGNSILCALEFYEFANKDFHSAFQFDRFCWNSSLTFNGRPYAVHPGVCQNGGPCISQYRIRDGSSNCLLMEDDNAAFKKNYCIGLVARHRFLYFNNESKCLEVLRLGTGIPECFNDYDEVWYGIGSFLQQNRKCDETDHSDCARLREYIGQSSLKNFTQNILVTHGLETALTTQIFSRWHCDSFWDLSDQMDESPSLCADWICMKNQYQCRTGQCIKLEWVCDGEWDCGDASDEEAIGLVGNSSLHNNHLVDLHVRVEQCQKRYSNPPFSSICNTYYEGVCYRFEVSNPLNIRSNRSGIKLAQIDNDIEHCYNAYDEKNAVKSKLEATEMWGFALRCDRDFEPYPYVCSTMKNKCTGQRECLHGDDEYWCTWGSFENQLFFITKTSK